MAFELPDLPYPLHALEPHVSRETLEFHHGRHHATYVQKLNELVRGKPAEGQTVEEIVRTAKRGPLFNNAAQHWNHSFYWKCLSPDGGGDPRGELERRVRASFGSPDKMRAKLTKAALDQFGTGWAWLVQKADGKLAVKSTQDAETPIARGDRVLLTCDVWEHAYYIDYRDARAKYVEAFWKIVNWDFVAKNLAADGQAAEVHANS